MRLIIFISVFLFGLTSCEKSCRLGVGKLRTEQLDLDPIHSVILNLDAELTIIPDSTQKVSITAQKNIIELINKNVSGGNWLVVPEEDCLDPTKQVTIDCRLTSISTLVNNGSNHLVMAQPFTGIPTLSTELNGSGDIQLRGSANALHVSLNGSGNVNAYNLSAIDAIIKVYGSGNAEVRISGEMRVEIHGSGNVLYKGDPANIHLERVGSGRLIKN